MQVSEIRIRKVEGEGKLKAYVTVTFDSCFVVHNVKIIEGKTGLFIAMPSRKTANGEYKDVAHPISPEFRTALQDQILGEYNAGHIESGTVGADGE
ncbi:MAG: septation regulator SpoVG [Treponema sp.]|nr:septation regulator SpoVG [Treponema sp.]